MKITLNGYKRYAVIVILYLLVSFCYGLNVDNNQLNGVYNQSDKSHLSLNNLNNKKMYSTFDEQDSTYHPDWAKLLCPNIANQIISEVPPDQSPTLKASDCDSNIIDGIYPSMLGGSCKPEQWGNFGERIRKSLVIFTAPGNRYNRMFCVGAVIGSKWIISSTECLTDVFGNFSSILNEQAVMVNLKYPVKTIYIPRDYPQNMSHDFALLELENPLPSEDYKPVKLANEYLRHNSNVWVGIGGQPNIAYRKQYFYDYNLPAGMLRISGSIPKGTPQTSWHLGPSFGAPALIDNGEYFSILGVYSRSEHCDETFFSETSYALSLFTSIPYNHDFILHFISDPINNLEYMKRISPATYEPPNNYKNFAMVVTSNSNPLMQFIKTQNKNGIPLISSFTENNQFPFIIVMTRTVAFLLNFDRRSISRYNIKGNNMIFLDSNNVVNKNSLIIDMMVIEDQMLLMTEHQLRLYNIDERGNLSLHDVETISDNPVSMSHDSLGNIFIVNKDSSFTLFMLNSAKKLEKLNISYSVTGPKCEGSPINMLLMGYKKLILRTDKQICIINRSWWHDIGHEKLNLTDSIELESILTARNDMILINNSVRNVLVVSSGARQDLIFLDINYSSGTIDRKNIMHMKGYRAAGLAAIASPTSKSYSIFAASTIEGRTLYEIHYVLDSVSSPIDSIKRFQVIDKPDIVAIHQQ